MYLNYRKAKYDENGNVRSGYEHMKMPKLDISDSIAGEEDALAAYGLSTVFVTVNPSLVIALYLNLGIFSSFFYITPLFIFNCIIVLFNTSTFFSSI